MIKLNKGPEPNILIVNSADWSADYVALKAAGGSDKTIEGRHRHGDIKAAVIAETFDKCMYCEEKISSSQFGDVEHIMPKASYPELYAVWYNLSLACEVCNNGKSNHVNIVNPFIEDPSIFVSFAGPMVKYKSTCSKGQQTVRALRLNRNPLVQRRAEAIKKLIDKIDLYESSHGAIREMLGQELRDAVADDQEYCGTLRAYLTAV